MIVVQLMARLIVTEHGLSWRSFLRTRSIAWSEIQDVLVVPAKAIGRYYSPGIKVDGKWMRISSVAGTRRYTETIVTAIRDAELRARVASAAHPGRGRSVQRPKPPAELRASPQPPRHLGRGSRQHPHRNNGLSAELSRV